MDSPYLGINQWAEEPLEELHVAIVDNQMMRSLIHARPHALAFSLTCQRECQPVGRAKTYADARAQLRQQQVPIKA